MVIHTEQTIIFKYPDEYTAEQEWLKTKGDEWRQSGYDTRGSAYTYSNTREVTLKRVK